MNNGETKDALLEMFEVDVERYSDAAQQRHVNQAIREIQQEFDNPYSEATDELDTVASQAAYSPTDDLGGGSPALTFSRCGGMYYLGTDGTEKEVVHRGWEVCRADYPLGTDEGAPECYALRGSNIVLFPTPDAVYTLYVDYWGYLAKLSADNDTNYWTANEEMLVQYKAAIHGCAHVFEENRIPMFQTLADEILDRVLIEFSQLEQSGRSIVSEEY